MTNAQSSFVWYELMTQDVPGAKAFYAGVVGWRASDMAMPDMTYTVLDVGDLGVAGMMPLPPHLLDAGVRPHWVGYLYAADVDALTVKLQGLGGHVHREPTDIPGVGRFAVVSDPQGAVFNLLKPNQPGERAHSTAPGTVGWHELHTTDWPRAFDFYHALFGWVKGDVISMGEMGSYQLFTFKDQPIGGMMNSPAATARRFWLYYFRVDDLGAAADRIVAGGGKIMHGPVAVPGGGWIVQAIDPQGAWFALLGPKVS